LLDKKLLLFKPNQYRFAATYIHIFIKIEPFFLIFPLILRLPDGEEFCKQVSHYQLLKDYSTESRCMKAGFSVSSSRGPKFKSRS
jgi:hypothetical protein